MKIEEILLQQPFHNIVRIIKAESLESSSAISGETFKVTGNDGKIYKLRYAEGWFKAREKEVGFLVLKHHKDKFLIAQKLLVGNPVYAEGSTLNSGNKVVLCN